LTETVAQRDTAMAERDGQISALYHSSSWQITWLLRIVGYQVKRSRRIADFAMSSIQRGGGLKNTLKKAIQLYRREGWAGIKRGFRIVATSGQTNPAPGSGEYDRNDYVEWIRRYDTLTDESRATMRDRIDNFVCKPLISVVMPAYNTKPEWLIEAIESIRKQIYPCWELCIADDASTDKRIRPILESYAREDTRIKVVFREKNGHISAASNSALELAIGEWVALLDHDDLLAEHALFWVADAINRDPDVKLIYSDEDKIDRSGRRFGHYFKCNWNVDLFYSHNLITHLGVYRTSLLNEIGGFREDMEGAQDYDLALRCIERIEPKQIRHIPRVLYHWRSHAKSTAQSAHTKPHAMLAGQRALNEHLRRQGVRAQAELIGHGFRVRYALPDVPPLVSLIIPTRNGFKFIQQCVKSILRKTTYPNYEIIIVDNGSDDPTTLEYFRHMESNSKVRILPDDRTFNFSTLNNSAVKKARGELVGLINSDIEVISPDWLSEMVSHALRPDVGAVGACLWYPNNTLQHGGVVLGIGGWAGHAHKGFPKGHFGYTGRMSLISEFMAVTGACLITRKSLYEKLGGLNETELQTACNDVDFCLRLREAGYRNIWTPYAELYHHESATRGFEDGHEKQARFAKEVQWMKQRWGDQLLNDPAYSPNLTLDHEDFSLAWPPRIDLLAPPHAQVVQQQSQLSRVDKALLLVDRKGSGLEIGPSHNPLAPKKAFFNVQILDHATREELIEKYRGHDVNLDNIEEVDFVWHGEPLQELIGKTSCYDWIIASHVIEHVPELISFLQQCEALLKPAGILSLVMPDKRYCFDYFSSSSSTGNVLDAYAERRVRPSHGQIFDHFSNAAKRHGKGAWSSDGMGGADELYHTFAEAQAIWIRSTSTTDYIDTHCWRFTPASFRLLISDLQGLGLIGLEIKAEFDTSGCEFFVSLSKKRDAPLKLDRLAILQTRKLEND
jgi:glycosyltransferase involved in cell wall biosynthesis/predicted SAM-dependent methyltransferase